MICHGSTQPQHQLEPRSRRYEARCSASHVAREARYPKLQPHGGTLSPEVRHINFAASFCLLGASPLRRLVGAVRALVFTWVYSHSFSQATRMMCLGWNSQGSCLCSACRTQVCRACFTGRDISDVRGSQTVEPDGRCRLDRPDFSVSASTPVSAAISASASAAVCVTPQVPSTPYNASFVV